jgi:DNA (cytosine-5)-methyltransferase 1
VPFMLHLGKGRALDVIVGELEHLGYKWAYRVVDARAFGVPQRRERVYLVATKDGHPTRVLFADEREQPAASKWRPGHAFGFYWTEGNRGLGAAVDAIPTLKGGSALGIPSAPAILMTNGRIITPDIRDAERMQGFPDGWTEPAEGVVRRNQRWKLVGNAVCVHVAEWIGRRLLRPGVYDGRLDPSLCASKPWPRAAWNDGEGRRIASLSAWPKTREFVPLPQFLRYPGTLLSAKATAGFLSRVQRSSLRVPDGFISALQRHLERVQCERFQVSS